MSNVELKGLKGLQGLDTLLAEAKTEVFTSTRILHIPIDRLMTGKYQPRTAMDESTLNDLALSIQSQGIILPLIVRELHDQHYEIIAGERRWRAGKIAGLTTVPAIVRDVSDETALAFALIENIQREALNPIDEALALVRLRDDFAMTHEEIAERVGRSRSTVTNLMRLLGLHDGVKVLLQAHQLEMGHARTLLSVELQQQLKLAHLIVDKKLSVRETEKIVQKMRVPQQATASTNQYETSVRAWETLLSAHLSAQVKINLNHHGEGKMVIYVHSPEEIEWIIGNLKPIPPEANT